MIVIYSYFAHWLQLHLRHARCIILTKKIASTFLRLFNLLTVLFLVVYCAEVIWFQIDDFYVHFFLSISFFMCWIFVTWKCIFFSHKILNHIIHLNNSNAFHVTTINTDLLTLIERELDINHAWIIKSNRSKWFLGSAASIIWDLHSIEALGVTLWDVQIISAHTMTTIGIGRCSMYHSNVSEKNYMLWLSRGPGCST